MHTLSFKEEAKRLIDSLPANATWSDLMYEIYVRREIEAGISDVEQGRVKSHEDVKEQFGQGK